MLFQSTLLQEERLDLVVRKGLSSLFQSTLLQEERLYRLAIEDHYFYNFNPRSYKRSDIAPSKITQDYL